MENNELYHWGVKGMKWGVRRYQNADGTLTPAGQKRRSLGQTIHDYKVKKKRKASLEKARAVKVEKQKEAAERKKAVESGRVSAKKMTEDELKARIARLETEKRYNELLRETQTFNKGKKFTEKFLNSTTEKLADTVAADLVAQTLKVILVEGANRGLKQMGLNPDVHTNNKKKN